MVSSSLLRPSPHGTFSQIERVGFLAARFLCTHVLNSARGSLPARGSSLIVAQHKCSPHFISSALKGPARRISNTSVWHVSNENLVQRETKCSVRDGTLVNETEQTEQVQRRRLVLYSKPGCCLCDGLKEKLQLVFMMGGEDSVSDVTLEVRDITTNEEWLKSYQYEIPVLARRKSDNSEEVLPRFSPRLSIEQLQKKIHAAFG